MIKNDNRCSKKILKKLSEEGYTITSEGDIKSPEGVLIARFVGKGKPPSLLPSVGLAKKTKKPVKHKTPVPVKRHKRIHMKTPVPVKRHRELSMKTDGARRYPVRVRQGK